MQRMRIKFFLGNMILARKFFRLMAAFWQWNACKLVEVTGGRNTDFRERPFQLSLLVMDDNWYNLLRNCRNWLSKAGIHLDRRTI